MGQDERAALADLIASICDTTTQSRAPESIAKLCATMRNELVDKGFTREEAMQILLSVDIVPKMTL